VRGQRATGSSAAPNPALAQLHVSGVEPEEGPVTLEGTVQERLHPLVDLLAKPRDLALRGARQTHRAHQVVNRSGGDAMDVGFLYHGHQCLLCGPSRLKECWEVTALAQLRNVQADGACPSIPLARPVAVALVLAVRAALAMSGAAHGGHLDVHQPLRGILDQLAQEIRVVALGDRLGKVDRSAWVSNPWRPMPHCRSSCSPSLSSA